MNVVPMAKLRNTEPVAETEKPAEQPAASEKQRNPIDPQVWYEVQGRKILETLITDLHSRGHSSLTIRENGDVVIKQADSDMVRSKLESVPEKTYWPRLCKVFESEGLAANITKGLCALPRLSEISFRQSTEAEAWLRLMLLNCMMKPADAIFIVTQTGFVR